MKELCKHDCGQELTTPSMLKDDVKSNNIFNTSVILTEIKLKISVKLLNICHTFNDYFLS